jgi:PqqD family protein of HPr-rel-A system
VALARAPHVTWVEVEREVIALDLRSGDVHLLDVPATFVWLLLEGNTVDALVAALAAAYGADVAAVRADVDELLAQLRDRGLVREATGGWPTGELSSMGDLPA